MNRPLTIGLIALAAATGARAHDDLLLPTNATFTTLATTALAIEGLTADKAGNFYTTGRSPGANLPCPVYRIAPSSVTPVVVGLVPPPGATVQCSPSGLTFGADGRLYISESDKVFAVAPNATTPATATAYGSGVPGTNGLAFDASGILWTGDGTTGQGRVWKIAAGGGAGVEVFRIQPMANEVNLDASGIGGVGRDVRSLAPGVITVTATSRNAQNALGSQPLVANGVAFDGAGNMFIADTARGAIWLVRFDRQGNMTSPKGCDTTFTPNTLCMSNVLVAHPLLEGADGIALDVDRNIWVAANERNAIVVVTDEGRVVEAFRNPVDATTRLRNAGPLEFPTSPFLAGNMLCTSNSDGNRRDNAPSTAGEIGGAGQPKGKISCLSSRLHFPGLPLPVTASTGHRH